MGGCRASSVIKFVWLANYDVVFQTPQWAGPARQGGAKAGADREGGSARGGGRAFSVARQISFGKSL